MALLVLRDCAMLYQHSTIGRWYRLRNSARSQVAYKAPQRYQRPQLSKTNSSVSLAGLQNALSAQHNFAKLTALLVLRNFKTLYQHNFAKRTEPRYVYLFKCEFPMTNEDIYLPADTARDSILSRSIDWLRGSFGTVTTPQDPLTTRQWHSLNQYAEGVDRSHAVQPSTLNHAPRQTLFNDRAYIHPPQYQHHPHGYTDF